MQQKHDASAIQATKILPFTPMVYCDIDHTPTDNLGWILYFQHLPNKLDRHVLRRYITRLAAVRHLVPTGVRYIQYRCRRAERNRDQNAVACSRPRTHIQSGRRRNFARADNR